MKRLLTSFTILLLTTLLSGNAMAAVVSFTGLSGDPLNPTLIQQGSQVSFDLVGTGFPAVSAGDFAVTFGTAGILKLNSFVAEPSTWDTSNLLLPPSPAVIGDGTMLVATSGASNSGAFTIGTLTFDVLGGAGSSTSIALSDAFSGWSIGLSTVAVDYVNAQVQVVPVPAAMWLMLSAIGGLGLFGKKRKLQVS